MIKKIIWTVVFMIPLVTGAVSTWGSDAGGALFNSGNVIDGWSQLFQNISDLIEENGAVTGTWLKFVWYLIIALVFTAPFWYAWKGTFIVGWIPLLGLILRISVIVILLLLPGVLTTVWPSAAWANQASFYMGVILIVLALLGLWIKS